MDGDWASPWADADTEASNHPPPPPPPPSSAPLTSASEAPPKQSSKLEDDPWGAFTDTAAWANPTHEDLRTVFAGKEDKKDVTEVFGGWGQEDVTRKELPGEELNPNRHAEHRFSTLGMAQMEDWGWGDADVGAPVLEKKSEESIPIPIPSPPGEINVRGHHTAEDDWGWDDAPAEKLYEGDVHEAPEWGDAADDNVEKLDEKPGASSESGPAQEMEENSHADTPAPEKPDEGPKELGEASDKVGNGDVVHPKEKNVTDGVVTPISPALGVVTNITAEESTQEDDDFGDFVSEPEDLEPGDTPREPTKPVEDNPYYSPTPPTSPQKPPYAASLETIPLDISLVTKLYPLPTSYPTPPPLEPELISSTEARKTWYRLTQAGSLRMSNLADTSDYVQVTWRNSKVREKVIAIVTKWAAEDQSTSRRGRGGYRRSHTSSPATAFGWGDPQPSPPPVENKRHSFGVEPVKKTSQDHLGHSRHMSDMGLIAGKLGKLKTDVKSSSLISPLTATPELDNLVSPLKSPGSPLKVDIMAPLSPALSSKTTFSTPHTSAFPPPTSQITSPTSSPRTPNINSTMTSSTSSQKATPHTTSTTRNQPTSFSNAVKESMSTTPPSKFDPWAAFDSVPASTQPSQATTASSDDWAMFDSLVSKPAALKPQSEVKTIPSFPPTRSIASPTIASAPSPAFSAKSPPPTSSTFVTPEIPFTRPRKESIPTTFTEILSDPNPPPPPILERPITSYSVTSTPRDELPSSNTEDEDDEWGEMVEPGSFVDDPIPAFTNTQPTSMFIAAVPQPSIQVPTTPVSYFNNSSGLSRSNTLPSRPKPSQQQQPSIASTTLNVPAPSFAATPTASATDLVESNLQPQSLDFLWGTPGPAPQPSQQAQPLQRSHSQQQQQNPVSSLPSFSFPAITSLPSSSPSSLPTTHLGQTTTPASGPSGSTATATSTTTTESSSGWDLSFFERPSSTPAQSVSQPPSAASRDSFTSSMQNSRGHHASSSLTDLWDMPAMPTKPTVKGHFQRHSMASGPRHSSGSGAGMAIGPSARMLSDDEMIVQDIIKSLPDLSYMLL